MLRNKKGIALVSLVLMIIVLLMITGMVTYVSYDIIAESKKTTFGKDLTNINDAIEEYYAVNGSIPILLDGTEVSSEEFKNKALEIYGNSGAQCLSEELIKNNDTDSKFYEIDITKLGIEEIKYGVKETDTDIYIVSENTNIVYYYNGYELSDNIYFSNVNITQKYN